MNKIKRPIVDFFDNEVEIGDRFYYYEEVGTIIQIMRSAVRMNIASDADSKTMTISSPRKGICLNKIPLNGSLIYRVVWSVWIGILPEGKSNYSVHNKVFHDNELEEAKLFFANQILHHSRVKLTKETKEILGKSV